VRKGERMGKDNGKEAGHGRKGGYHAN